jgi:hypothetical protein
MVFFTSQGTTPVEFFLGRYEPLPTDLGVWKEVGVDGATGLLREERCLLPPGRPDAGFHLHQVRYRDPKTNAISHVGPETRVRRRRVSAR